MLFFPSAKRTKPNDVPIFSYLLVKLAARCNLDCSYCYWFRDPEVYKKPAILTPDAELALCSRLDAHIRRYELDEFTILLHGGEPLLFGKKRFTSFLERLRKVSDATNCAFTMMVTTNGVLVDHEWARIFKKFGVHVSISIDGPAHIHDANRRDFSDRGSHAKATGALSLLRNAGLDAGIIAVCDPDTDPELVARHIVDDLGVRNFDILPPDATHDDKPKAIAPYYIKLFDHWHDKLGSRGVEIRIISAMLQGLYTGEVSSDSIGFGPVHTVTLLTDGSLEALDVLRISRAGITRTGYNILNNDLQDIAADEGWRRIYDASLSLPAPCLECTFHEACGGGHLAHRWSKLRDFDNPSVYCEDWKAILNHVWLRLADRISVVYDGGKQSVAAVPVNLPRHILGSPISAGQIG
jgi:uncharacterized protein